MPRRPLRPTPAEREEQTLWVLGLTLDYDQRELLMQVSEIAEYNRMRQAEIDERRSLRIPAEEPDEMDLGEARTVIAERERGAIIQPPKPLIPAPANVLETQATEKLKNDTTA